MRIRRGSFITYTGPTSSGFFTQGNVYRVQRVDRDGDPWCLADDNREHYVSHVYAQPLPGSKGVSGYLVMSLIPLVPVVVGLAPWLITTYVAQRRFVMQGTSWSLLNDPMIHRSITFLISGCCYAVLIGVGMATLRGAGGLIAAAGNHKRRILEDDRKVAAERAAAVQTQRERDKEERKEQEKEEAERMAKLLEAAVRAATPPVVTQPASPSPHTLLPRMARVVGDTTDSVRPSRDGVLKTGDHILIEREYNQSGVMHWGYKDKNGTWYNVPKCHVEFIA